MKLTRNTKVKFRTYTLPLSVSVFAYGGWLVGWKYIAWGRSYEECLTKLREQYDLEEYQDSTPTTIGELL